MAQIKPISQINLSDSGQLYTIAPTATFTGGFADSSDKIKFGNNSLDLSQNSYTYTVDSNTSMDGFIGFHLWLDSGALPDSSGANLKPLWEMGVNANGAFRRRFGLNSGGQIQSATKFVNVNGYSTWYLNNQYNTDERVQEGQWNFISLSFTGDDQGFATRRADVYINGVRTYYTNGTGLSGFFHDSDIMFGAQLAGDFNGTISFDSPTGMYMDNLYLDSVGYNQSTKFIYDSDSDGGIYTSSTLAKFQTFNNDSAEITTTIDSDGKVSSITITNGGNYVSAPTVAFTDAPESDIKHGDSASQTLASGVIITGEVIKYSDSDHKLYLAHVSADDGKYHTVATGRDITFGGKDRTFTREVISVTEDNKISENEQNDDFQTITSDFLDFSETNPFGDPS